MNNYTPKEQLFAQVDRQRELGVSAPGMDYLILAVAELRDAVRDVRRQLYQADKDREERHQETRARQDAFLSLAGELSRELRGSEATGDDPWAREPKEAREAEDEIERARRMPRGFGPPEGDQEEEEEEGDRLPHPLEASGDQCLMAAVTLRGLLDAVQDSATGLPEEWEEAYRRRSQPLVETLERWVREYEARVGVQGGS